MPSKSSPINFRNGLDHADLVEAFAPKPYLICSTTEDYFPIEGSRKTFEESTRIYACGRIHQDSKRQSTAGAAGARRTSARGDIRMDGPLVEGRGRRRIEPEPIFQTEYEEDLLAHPDRADLVIPTGDGEAPMNMRRLSALVPPRPRGGVLDRLKRREKPAFCS